MSQFANSPAAIVGAVLAGGTASRFDGPTHKLLAPLADGTPVLRAAVRAACGAGFGATAVVCGAVTVAQAAEVLDGLDVELIDNPDFASGQASSLQVAVSWARERGAESLVVGLGDAPGVGVAAWRVVGASRGQAVFARFGTGVAPPVKLVQAVWPLLPTTGDQGARVLFRTHQKLVYEVPCPGDPTDIVTAGDLELWNSQTNSLLNDRSRRPGES